MSLLKIPEQGGLGANTCAERAQGPAPAVLRRMAAFLYEGVLLFGLVMVVGAVYSISVNQQHGLRGREGMMAVQFLALALYFIWMWTHGGQTLALKTWQLRVLSANGQPISPRQALTRFMLSWLWFMPAWITAWAAEQLTGLHASGLLYGIMLAWIVIYAALTRLLPQGQFLHDVICGTRIIDNRKQLPA
ncbi:RDD family protein [Aquabacterium sp.]|uniref:RDD family protein n=1 Tax=Aquabacterium sp. TaxID=1872578 RepID=UPI0035B08191